jgi:hypothetical protein
MKKSLIVFFFQFRDDDENSIESNDQILCINSEYLDNKRPNYNSNINNNNSSSIPNSESLISQSSSSSLTTNKSALLQNLPHNSLKFYSSYLNNSLSFSDSNDEEQKKLTLLLSNNINKRLIRKNLKRPIVINNNFVKTSSSTSLSLLSLASLNSISAYTNSNLNDIHHQTNTNKQQSSIHQHNLFLFYNLKNDRLQIGPIDFTPTSTLDKNYISYQNFFSNSNKNNLNNRQFNSIYPEILLCHMVHNNTMVLNTEWTQVEIIELLNESSSRTSNSNTSANKSNNDNPPSTSSTINTTSKSVLLNASFNSSSGSAIGGGGCSGGSSSGFGFGITGNKSTGVVVKAITSGGSAAKVKLT